jgi:hypothetical protein
MSGKQSKMLRKLVGFKKEEGNSVMKRLYKRSKRMYSRSNEFEKPIVRAVISGALKK